MAALQALFKLRTVSLVDDQHFWFFPEFVDYQPSGAEGCRVLSTIGLLCDNQIWVVVVSCFYVIRQLFVVISIERLSIYLALTLTLHSLSQRR
jgi:hypothetical protein